MKVDVHVIPRAKRATVERLADGGLRVRVTQPPEDGRANAAVIEMVARRFGVPRRAVTIVRGATSRQKLIEIQVPRQCEPRDRLTALRQEAPGSNSSP